MNKFNLTFSGEIIAGYDPREVKLRFGKHYAIDDPVRLERFFSGETIILRRNMERREAARCYHELHVLGVVASLVKVTTSDTVNELVNSPSATHSGTQHAATAQPAVTRATRGQPRSVANKSRAPTTPRAPARRGAARPASTDPASPARKPRATADIAAAIKARKPTAQHAAAEHARKAAETAAEQRRAEEATRKAAETAAAEQRRVEEAACKAAETAAAEQRRVEEAARKAAETAAKQRKAEEAARAQAAKAEARRQAAAAEAQRKAQRKREKQERARQRAEAEARRKAELQAQQQRQAEETARRQAEQAELARREAEEEARLRAELAAIRQREEAEATRLQADLEARARAVAAEAERIRQVALQQQAQAQRNSAARRRAAAQELAARQAQRASIPVAESAPQPVRAPQPGAPNLYQLRPFRANEQVRVRAARALQLRRRSYTIGGIALAVFMLALGSFLHRTTETAIHGARAAVTAPHAGPVLLAGDVLLFHDRAGNSTTTMTLGQLQLTALEAPLVYDGDGTLYARGHLAGSNASGAPLQLLRCEPPLSTCQVFSGALATYRIDTFALNPVDGSVLAADVQAGLLLKVDRDGKLLASAPAELPPQPVLRLHGGLLLLNSASAPALSVLRYEDQAFGQQLDEVLLLPPTARDAGQSRVDNFLWSGDAWWVGLRDSASGAQQLHRFDEEWNVLGAVALPPGTGALQLTAWGSKTLVSDAQHVPMLRFNAQGAAEAPFVSSTLDALVAARQRHLALDSAAWHGGLLLCALLAVLGLSLGYLQTLRARVYNSRRESGAEPIDSLADRVHWLDPAAHRRVALRRAMLGYALPALGALLAAIALSVTAAQLAALLTALGGPLLALSWLARKPIGHIGVLLDRLVLVDHNGMYQIAGGSRIQHCGPFLCIDDVVVCSGMRMLPAFSTTQVQQQVGPLVRGAVKVDYRTVLVKLLESRHPLAVGVLLVIGACTAALLVLSLQGIH